MTRRRGVSMRAAVAGFFATCLAGVGLVVFATSAWATPPAAPPYGPASGVAVNCAQLLTPPGSSLPCTITGLSPSESASVNLVGTSVTVAAPPADASGTSTVALPIPAAGTGMRTIQISAPQSRRTASTSVDVDTHPVNLGSGAASPLAQGGSGGHTSSGSSQKTAIPPHALLGILVAVFGIVVLTSRKQLQRMKA